MPVVPFNKFNNFITRVAAGVHVNMLNADTDTVKAYLSNAVPDAALDSVKADLLEITAGNGYVAGGNDVQNAATQSGAIITVVGVDFVITAAGGPIGPFRYIALYNDTIVTPLDPLIGWWDYGSSITLADGETFTMDFSTNLFTLG